MRLGRVAQVCLGVVHVITLFGLHIAGIVVGLTIRTIVPIQVSVRVRLRSIMMANIVSWTFSAGIYEAVFRSTA